MKTLFSIFFIVSMCLIGYSQNTLSSIYFDIPIDSGNYFLKQVFQKDTSKFEIDEFGSIYLRKKVWDKITGPNIVMVDTYFHEVKYELYAETDSLNKDSILCLCQDVRFTFRYEKGNKKTWKKDYEFLVIQLQDLDPNYWSNIRVQKNSRGFQYWQGKVVTKYRSERKEFMVNQDIFPTSKIESRKYLKTDGKYAYEIILTHSKQ